MEDRILQRYETDPAGYLIVDVAPGRVEDLYQNFDRTAPYQKKDLDDDLAGYLVDCAREIGSRPFVIRIRLPAVPADALVQRVRSSVYNYFLYRAESERRALLATLRTCAMFLAAGIVLLAASLLALGRDALAPTLPFSMFAQGMTIAAWVAVWQALATFLVQVPSQWRAIRVYRRIAAAQVDFKALIAATAPPQGPVAASLEPGSPAA